MFRLLKYAKEYKIKIILGPIFKFLEAVFELLLPIYMAKLVDEGIRTGNRSIILKNGGLMLGMTLLGLVCVMICQYFSSFASQGFGTELRNRLMKKINTLSHQELNDLGTATLVTRITSDTNQLQLALAMLIRLVIRAPFLSIGSIVMAFTIDKQLALIFLFSLPIFCIILFFISKKTVPLYQKVQKKLDNLNQIISENLTGVRVIRAFARKKRGQEQVNQVSDELAKAYQRVTNISALLNPATTLIMNVGIMTLLYFGSFQVNIGNLQQGQMLALINYMTQMLLSLIIVSNLVIIFTRAKASANRIQQILDIVPSISQENSGQQVPFTLHQETDSTPVITMEDVAFRYTTKSGLALKNLDFSLTSQENLGIIGPTGSGKSTLLNLLPRFYDATEGNVLIDGENVKDWPIEKLRSLFGIVPQTSVLFSGTIRENLQWGKQEATDEECYEALEIAQCLEFFQTFPDGLDHPVEAGGKNFSGGQRQRLAIARGIIRKPKFLLLDDALSALDYQTDFLLRSALTNKLHKTQTIIVSQRMSSIQHVAKILVLDDGEQVGFGSHEELLNNCLLYRNIYDSQQKEGSLYAKKED